MMRYKLQANINFCDIFQYQNGFAIVIELRTKIINLNKQIKYSKQHTFSLI